MKYAMMVALLLLGACAADEGDQADDSTTEVTTETSPLQVVDVAAGAAAPPAALTATTTDATAKSPQTAIRFSPQFGPDSSRMMLQSEPTKPQPDPWAPVGDTGGSVANPSGDRRTLY